MLAYRTIFALILLISCRIEAATIQGYVLDPNWWSPHPKASGWWGTGVYEYGIAGNPAGSSALGLFSSTESYADNYWWGVYGFFRKPAVPDGNYTISTWDVWWRPSFVFNSTQLGAGTPVVIRLKANMWSYAPTWEANYNEFGQTFEATGSSVTMISIRSAVNGVPITCSVHVGGPGGAQIGPSRSTTSSLGDMRFIWSGGELPTTPGHIYYVRFKAPDGNNAWVACNNEPVPDFSDAMPGGSAHHNGAPWSQVDPYKGPSMDLGMVIHSDDDGIVTNMFVRPGGQVFSNASSIGQTFTASGTSLISFCAWIPHGGVSFVATVYNAINGTQIGAAKTNQVMRWADPEALWTWAPGEVPLTPGQSYYVEVTRQGGGSIPSAYYNAYSVYGGGDAVFNRVPNYGSDVAGTIMEEESAGSATLPTLSFTTHPGVVVNDRLSTSLTVRLATSLATSTEVEYSAWTTPYTHSISDAVQSSQKAITLTGLKPNTMYHLRVKSSRSGYRTLVSRDIVACTTTGSNPNLLVNPGFEDGSGSSPRKPIQGWSGGGIDLGASNGTWFWGLPAYKGSWFAQGAVNAGTANGHLYQTISGLQPGKTYNFTTAVTTWMRENDTWKYDVWHEASRLSMIRIGIDPNGYNNPGSGSIRWTPWMYSHLRYTNFGIRSTVNGASATVVIQFKGEGGQWHLYGVDDCLFSLEAPDDTSPPTTPIVNAASYTTSTTTLSASWSASDPETGVTEYQYSIGTTSGAADILGWKSAGTTTTATEASLSLSPGTKYYFSVRAINGANLWSSAGSDDTTVAFSPQTIGQARLLSDGTPVFLSAKPVTASVDGNFWLEEADRSAGIRVASAVPFTNGSRVSLYGRLQTQLNERRLEGVQLVQSSSGPLLKALRISASQIGGSGLAPNLPQITGGYGTNNVGLLMRIAGRVMAVSGSDIWVDDGSLVTDIPSPSGIVIKGATGMAEGDLVEITGIVSTCEVSPGNTAPCLLFVNGVALVPASP